MKIKKHVSLALLLSLSITTSALAQSHFQLLGDLSNTQSRFSSLESSGSTSGASGPLTFNVTHASFSNGNQSVKDTAAILLLKGTGTLNGVSVPIAGSVYRQDGVSALHINFIAPPSSFNANTAPVEVVQKLDGSDPTVEIAKPDILDGKKCGLELLPKVSAPATLGGSSSKSQGAVTEAVTTNSIKVIDLATDADFEFYSRYGSATNTHIASIVNAAQVIYERDLGLHFNIMRQRVKSSSSQPYTSSASDVLLDQFSNEVTNTGGLAGADVVHLFTGKDLNENIVGLAWLGVLCTTPSLSTSLTQAVSTSIDPVIFAHELGHNIGADHDSGLPRSLMYPMAGADQTFFSQTSKNQIAAYFAQGGDDCFATEAGGSPTPTPTATPNPTPTPTANPGGGGGSGSGSGSPIIGFSSSFNKTNGTLTINVSRRNISAGTCTATVLIGGSSKNLANAAGVDFDSAATKLVFTTKTTKRLSSPNGKIFLQGEFSGCPNDEDVVSAPIEISPSYSRSTKRTDKVSARTWINYAIQKMTVRER